MTSLAELLGERAGGTCQRQRRRPGTGHREQGQGRVPICRLWKSHVARICRTWGFAGDAAGVQAWLKQVAAGSETAQCWSNLLAATAKANENNRTNGLMINRHMNVTQSALKILQQNDPTAAAGSFYGPSGHTTVSTSAGRGFAAR